jgi:hypothetical protein
MAKGEGGASAQACHAEEGEGERALAQRWAARDGRQWPLAIGRRRRHATRTGEPGGGDWPVGHGHSDGRLCRRTSGPGRHNVGFK